MDVLTLKSVNHLAKLANIGLKDNEIKLLKKQLEETIKYVDKLNKIDTSSEKPTNHVTGLSNVYRNDEPSGSLSQEEALSQSGFTYNGYFRVKGILNKE